LLAYFGVGDAGTALKMLAGRRAMVSFAYYGTSYVSAQAFDRLLGACSGVAVDSGAFTAWRKGLRDWPAHAERYKAFLRSFEGRFDFAVSLDVIGDAEASLRAWLDLTAEGFNVVPVWHEGDPLEHLDAYGPADRLVGLGRTEGRRCKTKGLAFYDDAFNHYPAGRFHALGNASPEQLSLYPFHSFDAVTWQLNSTYAGKFGWPWSACSKQTRMLAYLEASETIAYVPAKQLDLFGKGAS
jgi:hypothetical protein